MSRLKYLASLERHRMQIERTKENGARLAKSYLTWTTTGWGEFVNDVVMDFGLTFTEKPSFTFGFELDSDNGPDLVDGRFPRGNAFVYDYRKVHPLGDDSITYYTGAWCAFVFEDVGFQFSEGSFDTTQGSPQYRIHWSLQFEGIALKDLPSHLLEKVDASAVPGTGA